MNKRKKVAWRKHRVKTQKLQLRRKQSGAAGGKAGARAAS